MRHIAMIPARMGSVGFKFKNRKFFDYTADFVQSVDWLERVIVSTDDPVVGEYAGKRGFEVHQRPEELAGPAVSIHRVFERVIPDMAVRPEDVLWLFYLPVLYKDRDDFESARTIIEREDVDSLCTFVPARSHPFNCWGFDPAGSALFQYVENDCFRRQDLPPAWIHYHYVYCFKAAALSGLNSEMINSATHPVFLDDALRDQLIEIDTPEDYERWQAAGCPRGKHHEEN